MLIKCIKFFLHLLVLPGPLIGFTLSETVSWHLEGLEHIFPEPWVLANQPLSPKSWHLPLVISHRWVHLFDFGKVLCADLKQARLLVLQHGSTEAIEVSSHWFNYRVVGKIVKSRSLKSAIFRCPQPFSWLPMVPLDFAWNFDGSLTRNFGSFGPSLSFYSKWKSSKIADFSPHVGCQLGQTSTSKSHPLVPNDLGTWRKLPQGTRELDG